MSISRKYRKDPEYPAFVEWLNGPMTELPRSDGAYGEPRIWAFEGVDEWFLYLLWKAASKPAAPIGKDAVTREQIQKWARLAGFGVSITEGGLAALGDFAILARYPAAPAQSAEPIYQIRGSLREGHPWHDVGVEGYARAEKRKNWERRIVYTAPQPSPTAVVLDDERAAFEADCTCDAPAGVAHNEACPVTHAMRHAFAMSGESARATSPQPVAQTVEKVTIPRELAENYLNLTNIPRYRRILESALAAPQPVEQTQALTEVGIASAMPGTDAWTIVVCKTEDVPIGTPLYKKGK